MGSKRNRSLQDKQNSQQELSFASVCRSYNLSQLMVNHSPPTGRRGSRDKLARKETETNRAAQHKDHRYAVMGYLHLN